MDSKDWYNCGARIGDLVQSAIDRQDFRSLNESILNTISQTLDSAVDTVQSAVDPEAAGQTRRPEKMKKQGGYYRSSGTAYQKAKEQANVDDVIDVIRRSVAPNTSRGGEAQTGGRTGRSLKGIFSMVAGYGMAVFFGLFALLFLVGGLLTGAAGATVTGVLLAVLTALFAIVGARGGGYRSRLKQVEQYLKIMDGRDVVTVEELASGTGKTVKEVQKELRQMIKDGMFASGAYLDPDATNLMTSRKAYQQYQETMKAYRQRQEERAGTQTREIPQEQVRLSQEQRRAAEKDLASYSDETRRILREGQEFIAHIHAANEAIPGEEISEKLDRLEQVVARIFDQVAGKPDSAPDLHKMMSYYLPITRKLVDAYADLDKSSIQGENVTKTKQEIEVSLDTINLAFETFLDSFYQDTAWDISSDISALKTMMARDGLTGGGDFARTRKVAEDVRGESSKEEKAMTPAASASPSQTAASPAASSAGTGGAAAAAAPVPEKES